MNGCDRSLSIFPVDLWQTAVDRSGLGAIARQALHFGREVSEYGRHCIDFLPGRSR